MRWSLALVVLCAAASAAARDGDLFQCEELNIKLTIADGWRKSEVSRQNIRLILERNNNTVLLLGYTAAQVPENMCANYETEMNRDNRVFKRVRKENVRIGDDVGIEAEYEFKEPSGLNGTAYLTFFSHQGISYRFAGVQINPLISVLKDYRKMRDSIQYMRNRSDWLDANVGALKPHGLAGGLAAWKLKFPRWQESTFSHRQEEDFLESAHYQLITGGAWATVRVAKTSGTPAEELEKLRQYLCSFYKNLTHKPAEAQGRAGRVACIEISGPDDKFPRLLRCAVFTNGELTVQVWLECLASLSDETAGDWEHLLLDFVLKKGSEPGQEPAYPLAQESNLYVRRVAKDALFTQGERRLATASTESVLGLDPAGKRALVCKPGSAFLYEAETGLRKSLALAPAPNLDVKVAWSPDGKRIAYVSENKIAVVTLEPFAIKTVNLRAREIAWGPTDDELYAVAYAHEDTSFWHFSSDRLVMLTISDGKTRTLMEYPLARIGCLALSPDGKTLAFVCNKDAPRTGLLEGHVYTARPDGGDPQSVTASSRALKDLQWSGDATKLYAFATGPSSESGWNYGLNATSLCVIPVAEDGEVLQAPVSLRDFWIRGDDLYMQTSVYGAHEDRGLYRLKASALEAAAKSAPKPPEACAETARLVAERIKQALKKEPKKFKPTSEAMAEIAEAFAAAMKETRAAQLDFSPDSLHGLANLAGAMIDAEPDEDLLLLGAGAYYGETLRRAGSAEWALHGQEWSGVRPRMNVPGNALAECVFPFEDLEAVRSGSEEVWLRQGNELEPAGKNARYLLVYPPSYAAEAMKKATPDGYRSAQEKIKAGQPEEALEQLVKEMEKYPQNEALAREAIALSMAVGNEERTRALVRRAVEAGSKVQELLLRYADETAEKEPAKALEAYRRALNGGGYGNAEPLIKMGAAYLKQGQPETAEACWRKAYFQATRAQKAEIMKRMGLAKDEAGTQDDGGGEDDLPEE